MKRKVLVKNRADYAFLLTRLEGKKSSIKVGDAQEFLKIQEQVEIDCYLKGMKSPVMIIRRSAVAKAKAEILRRKKLKKSKFL